MGKDYSKKRGFALRINEELKSDIKRKSQELNISENALINLAINNYLKSLGA